MEQQHWSADALEYGAQEQQGQQQQPLVEDAAANSRRRGRATGASAPDKNVPLKKSKSKKNMDYRSTRQRVLEAEQRRNIALALGMADVPPKEKTGYQLYHMHRIAELKEEIGSKHQDAFRMAAKDWSKLPEDEKQWYINRSDKVERKLAKQQRNGASPMSASAALAAMVSAAPPVYDEFPDPALAEAEFGTTGHQLLNLLNSSQSRSIGGGTNGTSSHYNGSNNNNNNNNNNGMMHSNVIVGTPNGGSGVTNVLHNHQYALHNNNSNNNINNNNVNSNNNVSNSISDYIRNSNYFRNIPDDNGSGSSNSNSNMVTGVREPAHTRVAQPFSPQRIVSGGRGGYFGDMELDIASPQPVGLSGHLVADDLDDGSNGHSHIVRGGVNGAARIVDAGGVHNYGGRSDGLKHNSSSNADSNLDPDVDRSGEPDSDYSMQTAALGDYLVSDNLTRPSYRKFAGDSPQHHNGGGLIPGLCVNCREEPVIPGTTTCLMCVAFSPYPLRRV